MNERVMLFGRRGELFYVFDSPRATPVSFPDDSILWTLIWGNRAALGGVAHTHPGRGAAVASPEDLTTFSAIERGVGKVWWWPVVTADDITYYRRQPEGYRPGEPSFSDAPCWRVAVERLRSRPLSSRRTD